MFVNIIKILRQKSGALEFLKFLYKVEKKAFAVSVHQDV